MQDFNEEADGDSDKDGEIDIIQELHKNYQATNSQEIVVENSDDDDTDADDEESVEEYSHALNFYSTRLVLKLKSIE